MPRRRRGLKIDREVYRKCGKNYRIYPNALTCNSLKLPDNTIVMATDLGFHLSTLFSMFSWDDLKLFKYMNDMTTDYRPSLVDREPMLLYKGEEITSVILMTGTEFFRQKTSSGMPFMGTRCSRAAIGWPSSASGTVTAPAAAPEISAAKYCSADGLKIRSIV